MRAACTRLPCSPTAGLASGCDDYTIRLWDVVTRACTAVLQHESSIWAVAVLSGGRLASSASGCGDSSIYIWEVAGGVCEAVLEEHADSAHSLAALPNGLLASGSEDKSVRVWDVAAYACVAMLEGHRGTVCALAA